jgi:hypothetical protein
VRVNDVRDLRGLRFHAAPGQCAIEGSHEIASFRAAVTDNHNTVLLYMTADNKYFVLGQPLELIAQLLDEHKAKTTGGR